MAVGEVPGDQAVCVALALRPHLWVLCVEAELRNPPDDVNDDMDGLDVGRWVDIEHALEQRNDCPLRRHAGALQECGQGLRGRIPRGLPSPQGISDRRLDGLALVISIEGDHGLVRLRELVLQLL
eukprot:15313525-Alexandrium_andersonii.AAC.1